MKVVYANVGIPLYLHPLLEKVVSKRCELVMVLPEKQHNTIGEGVKLYSAEKSSYKVCYSRSKKMWYGKPALVDLEKILIEETPDILVLVWPYFLHLFFDRSILRTIKEKKIGLIIREIPFQVAPFKQLNYYKKHPIYDENMVLQSRGISFYLRSLFVMYVRRYIYHKIDAAVNYTNYAKDILPSYGVDPKSIFVSYNTTDTDALFLVRKEIEKRKPLLRERPRILHIGRLVKWKRVDLLIDAFALIADKFADSELVIVGDGPEKDALVKQSQDMNLSDRVVFTGAVHDSYVLGQYMYESTIYVLAGMGGLSINDAMCFSLPVICSVCDGTERELVTENVNGYFFEEGNVKDLADKIGLLLSNKEKAKVMGDASLQAIKEKVNLETVSDHYIKAFDYVMKKKNKMYE